MTYKTILTHVQPEAEAAPRLKCAVDLSAEFGAHLIGLAAEAIPPLGFTDPYGLGQGEMIVALRESMATNQADAEKAFREAVGQTPCEWRTAQDMPSKAMARCARAADLIVAGGAPRDASDAYRLAEPGELTILAGRPVLVAPPGGGRLRAKSIVVAWKDSREARRALGDALPFLMRADRVLVVAVAPEPEIEAAQLQTDDVAAALRRHGVPADAKVVASPGEDGVCDELLAQAQAIDADLVVSGAYGHSRFQEWVMGGVTRDLLRTADRFVLLSH